MIGLVDYDFLTSKKNSILLPNIEIMKLASYYKVEKNEFCKLLTLDENQELSSFDKIYFFSESRYTPEVPINFLRAKNVIFGGTGFTKEYKPFENSLIDYCLPRPSIYKDFLKQKYNDGVKTKIISHFLDDTYYRNYAGENKLPLPAIVPNKKIYLYDKSFFYPDWKETLDLISSRKPSSIIRIHPVICNNLTDFFIIRKYVRFSRANEIILDLNIPLNEVNYMFKHYKNLLLAEILPISSIYIPFGGNQKTNTQYFRDLIYKLNLVYSFWSKNIPIKMYFQTPDIGNNNPLQNLSYRIETWTKDVKKDITIYERVFRNKKMKIEQEEINFLLKFYPTAKTLFDQSYESISKRGYWRV